MFPKFQLFIYYLSKNLNNKQINSHDVTLKLRQETTQKAETTQEKDFSKKRNKELSKKNIRENA